MTTIVVFAGPTLSADEGRAVLDAVYLPPAAQGDVLRVSHDGPQAIGLIDGYFHSTPAVWHKELLWAMRQGIHVFGASSMGALRAAELTPFGMRGVGSIFEAFRDGRTEDDDEVAVAHGDGSTGYRATSEAMVNVRATCERAVERSIITPATRSLIEAAAKALYYPDRTYAAIETAARAAGGDARELARFAALAQAEPVNQKRLDALAMLAVMQRERAQLATPFRATFAFEHTETWEQAMASARQSPGGLRPQGRSDTTLLEELRLRGPAFAALYRGALLRALAAAEAHRASFTLNGANRESARAIFRSQRQLASEAALDGWLEANGLTGPAFDRFLDDEARLRWLHAMYAGDVPHHIRHELATSGLLPDLLGRAAHKEAVLSARGLAEPVLSETGLSAEQLLRWYFEDRLGARMPRSIEAYLFNNGLADLEALLREALREYLYLELTREG